MRNNALIILVKPPELGKVKTRLAATLGNDKALTIYKRLLEYTQSITKDLEADLFVYYADKIIVDDIWSDGNYQKKVQKGADLGERMSTAFKEVFDLGYAKVTAIGSDCIELKKEIIEAGFQALKNNNCTIGPALDGGYYLIGLSDFDTSVFSNISWSTSEVFNQTKNNLSKLNWTYQSLKALSDLDDIEDFNKLPEQTKKYLLNE